ncbi:hypothetical protein AVEN_30577-1 [Araneus ventricosus]|uniref:Uncharacterized protein n=1 Tax=Araneus ventricosus TaxID=182803 RepID=A0A4Y2ENA9_ARAVE|nr:hypothetical protein AVEN_30577-1 [Araneus ventricosus]
MGHWTEQVPQREVLVKTPTKRAGCPVWRKRTTVGNSNEIVRSLNETHLIESLAVKHVTSPNAIVQRIVCSFLKVPGVVKSLGAKWDVGHVCSEIRIRDLPRDSIQGTPRDEDVEHELVRCQTPWM